MGTALSSLAHIDLSAEALFQQALNRQEGELCANGSLVVKTGKRTGRSPKDRFIVKDDITRDTVDWGTVNQPVEMATFNHLWAKAEGYLAERELFISHLRVGADARYGVPVKVITQTAYQNLFAHHLFIREAWQEGGVSSYWTVLSVPGLNTDPAEDDTNSDAALMINFTDRKILLCGLWYAGEIKKAMFSILNFLSPAQGVLPMHCAANLGANGDTALFFGLSGTGKTTLSADPTRFLIGDDEHGWSSEGVYNFEGGCYAKCINLSAVREPVIWQAIRSGAILENVVIDPVTKEPDYDDTSLTQNTRAAYPREHIEKRVLTNCGGHPTAVIFLTCDLYGVLPPVSILTKEQAAYQFLSGYTALVGSTEVGQGSGIKPTFSTCFGAPFFPRPASVYAQLLLQRIDETKAPVYLVNTGWTGGAHGEGGERFSIPTTRAVIDAILTGAIQQAPTAVLPGFHFVIPTQLPGVDSQLLDPRKTWKSQEAYERFSKELMQKFIENFKRFKGISADILNLGSPQIPS